MTSYVCRFPDGKAGVGLLVLRLGIAATMISAAIATQAPRLLALTLQIGAGLFSLMLLVGIATRSVALLCGALALVALPDASLPIVLLDALGNAIAVVMLGPGAYSLDARLQGRRVIHVRPDP